VNRTTAIFLVNPSVRCVSVAYDVALNGKGERIGKDVKSFKTLDPAIKAKDLVLIPTDSRWGFTVGRVEEIELHVDYDSPEQMRWIVGVIDTSSYEEMLTAETEMMNAVAEADREHRRQELADKMFKNVDPGKLAAIGVHQSAPPAPPPSAFEPPQRGGTQQGVSGRAFDPNDVIPL
jgi:hypothetical protein